jgi:adenylate kinase
MVFDPGGAARTNLKSTTVCDASERIEKHRHQYIHLRNFHPYPIEVQFRDRQITTKRVMKEAAPEQQNDVYSLTMRRICISATLVDTMSS